MQLTFVRVARACALVLALALCFPSLNASAQDAPIATGQQTNGSVKAEILSVKRTEGDTITFRFAVINGGSQDFSMTLGNMQLIDLVNRRSYSSGLSSSCQIKAGAKTICWAIFGAPPVGVKSINIKFYENFDLISVPLPS